MVVLLNFTRGRESRRVRKKREADSTFYLFIFKFMSVCLPVYTPNVFWCPQRSGTGVVDNCWGVMLRTEP